MNILIVDDEEVLQDVLTSLIRRAGHSTISARTGEEALELLLREEVDLVLLDLMLPGMSGLQVLQEVRRRDPEQVVVVITAYSSIESAVDAMREGAFHYIPKPFKNEEVLLTLRRALELIRLAAPAKSNILILGESGTGKELVAKAIHHHSRRAEGAFVTVNSGSMPADLLESSLFGHVKGSFTGAIAHKRGLFELANGGSIFFDEIGNIPPDTQAKLLRVIQEREFMRVGGLETIRVDVRIIAATNADLESLVESGGFREDLYYRLNVITITLPPLRKRSEDIPLLVRHFLGHYAEENEKPLRDIAPRAMELLMDYHWPGNVRELENVIERAVVLSTGSELDVDLLPSTVRQPGTFSLPAAVLSANGGVPFKEAVGAYERQLIIKALKSAGGVQKRAAELLQVKPTTLHEMMKRLNISADSLVS